MLIVFTTTWHTFTVTRRHLLRYWGGMRDDMRWAGSQEIELEPLLVTFLARVVRRFVFVPELHLIIPCFWFWLVFAYDLDANSDVVCSLFQLWAGGKVQIVLDPIVGLVGEAFFGELTHGNQNVPVVCQNQRNCVDLQNHKGDRKVEHVQYHTGESGVLLAR